MITLAIASMKGGVGKTTLTTHLGAALAARGVRVLLLDMDTQGHVAAYLGAARTDAAYQLLTRTDPDREGGHVPLRDLITRDVREGLDVVAGNPRTAFAEPVLTERMGRERVLARRLREVDGLYDVTLIDVPPGFSVVSSVALYAAQGVLIPLIPGAGPESGVQDLLRRLDSMRREVDHAPALLGVVPNMAAPRERETHAMLTFAQDFPHGPTVRRATRMVEAVRAGQMIGEYDPRSGAAEDYETLARWAAKEMQRL